MARLPDSFDLWVRKARASTDPARQVDYILGALAGLTAWHFLNLGTEKNPHPARDDEAGLLLVYSDVERIKELKPAFGTISIPFPAAMTWCVEQHCGLMVNHEVIIPFPQVRAYSEEWHARGGALTSGFWIPNMTDEEEDFWQEHGL